MRYIFFLLLVFNLKIIAQQGSTGYPSLLWKITGKTTKKPSYLYGTMHVSNKVAYHLSDQFFETLKSVDVVGLETNPGDWLKNMSLSGQLDQESQLNSMFAYGKDFYKSSFNYIYPEKKMLQSILGYDPDIINGLLYRRNKNKENFEENTYIDLFIFQAASKLNKKVISLEDFTKAEIYAELSYLPDENIDGNDPDFKPKYSYNHSTLIEDAYRRGDLNMLDSISKLGSTQNTVKFLINARNEFFVNTIDSVLQTNTLFSGVGAAHLPGKDGVIELLRKKGYKVEPIMPILSKQADKTKDEIDNMAKPILLERTSLADSTISILAPGKYTQIVNLENLKYFINADMANGTFYTIVQLKTYLPVNQQTPENLMKRVDSLLFENIPGKIITKKEIVSANGLKGLELINKTTRGDLQHYYFYFDYLNFWMFKIGGKGNSANSAEANKILTSINFITPNDKAITFQPKNKGFEVMIPGNYTYSKNNGSSQVGLVEDLYAYDKNSDIYYGIKRAVYNDFNYLEEDTFELNQLAKNTLKNFNYTSNISYQLTTFDKLQSIQFTGKNNANYYFNGQIIIKGIHYYLIYSISKNKGTNSDFIKTFKLIPFEHSNPLKEITDKDFGFKAIDEVSSSQRSKFNEAFEKVYDTYKSKKNEDDYYQFDLKTSLKSYYSPSTNEYVNISYTKYNDYDYINSKEINEILTKNLRKQGLVLKSIKSSLQPTSKCYSITAEDTATSRQLEIRVVYKNGIRLETTISCDSNLKLSGWSKQFIESFKLTDTIIGKNVFDNKFDLLVKDLTSSDTSLRQKANFSIINTIGVSKDQLKEYIDLLKSDRFNQINEDARAQLIVNGGALESEIIIEPLKKLYIQYTDSFYLQLCILKSLAYLKTQTAFNTFLNLATTEAPLLGEEQTVTDVIQVLNDSLELCKNFFPMAYALTKYEEFKPGIYNLLANLVEKKLISSTNYQIHKESILADANLYLKRSNSAPTKSNGNGSDLEYLDKGSKELAELIKTSMAGYAKNLEKDSKINLTSNAFSRAELLNYVIVLAPFYKTDEKVKLFFEKLKKLKNQALAMPIHLIKLKNVIPVDDTLNNYFSKNRYTRVSFLSELEKEKMISHFKKAYLNQESLNESVIYSEKQLNNLTNYDKYKQKDSISLLKVLDARNKFETGKIFIYKNFSNKIETETWSVIFVPKTKENYSSKIQLLNLNYYIKKTKSEQENINEILNSFYLLYRNRAISYDLINDYAQGMNYEDY